jgi:nucleoside-diphosphate-sugar epimerase
MASLLTGGSGCIGSYVIHDLLVRGERVVNIDADPRGSTMYNNLDPT